MGKYLDPKYDLTFKAVFAEHPDLIISFLNALLPFKEGAKVVDIEYLPPELVPDSPLKKYSIVDVRCKDDHGRQFIVEMQMYWTDEFKQRVLFNASKAYVKQADKGYSYSSLQPVYSLSIVNDNAFSGTEHYHLFQMAEQGNPERVIEGIEMVFVELPKFVPQSAAVGKMHRLWLRFMTEINEKTQDAPQELLDDPEISKAISIVERGAYSDEQLATYDKYRDMAATEKALIDGSFNKGRAEGEAIGLEKGEAIGLEKGEAIGLVKGRAEGEAIGMEKGEAIGLEKGKEAGKLEEKKDNARKMKECGVDIHIISTVTGLSADEIEKH
ncbi:MAG: Rpn family recombination-promoting nuclease/putative transposase [Paludibacteraceae bacterium]|nr:Rpn family recombination-promoting nuclease/putative transposase [Paludibacteraceae bacterium]